MVIRRSNSAPMPEMERTDCKICSQSNNVDDMVGCDLCRDWFHFGCVNVNASVVEKEWICAECDRLRNEGGAAGSTNDTPVTTSSGTAAPVNMSGGTLLDAREMQLKILHEQQELLQREMQMQYEQEFARKKMQLEKLMLQAKMEIMTGANMGKQTVLTDSLQSNGADFGKVESWMKRMEIEAKNLSTTPPGGSSKATSASTPTFGCSSTPTSKSVSNAPHFDVSLPPVSQTSTTAQAVTSVSAPESRSKFDHYRSLGAVPKQAGGEWPSMEGLIFSGKTAIPSTSISNPVRTSSGSWSALSVPVTETIFPTASTSNVLAAPQTNGSVNTSMAISSANPMTHHTHTGTMSMPVSSASPLLIPMPANPLAPHLATGSSMNPLLFPMSGLSYQPVSSNPLQNPVGLPPTSQQLLARQVIPRELPVFDGDPDDWPMFYSTYVNSSSACGFSEVENLARLQKALKGRAYDAVKSRLLLPACVPQVIATLFTLFGRPELIVHTLLNKLRDIPAPKADRLETLISFGTAVQNLCDHLEAAGQVAHLCNPVLLQELVEKIPAQLRLNWALYKRQFPAVDLRVFGQYMSTLVSAASDVTVIPESRQQKVSRLGKAKDKPYLNTHTVGEVSTTERLKKDVSPIVLCLVCEDPKHKVKDCAKFRKMDQANRWKFVQENHLCRICLGKHGRRPCKSQARCDYEGCNLRHHSLLHAEKDSPGSIGGSNVGAKAGNIASEQLNSYHQLKHEVLFRMLPVQLRWNGNVVNTYAFLDDGSSLTLVDQSITNQLGIDDGEPLPLCMGWTSNITRRESNSERVRIQICGVGMKDWFWLNDTRTVGNLNLPEQTLDYKKLTQHYSHLRGLPVGSYESVSPGILIGSNNASLLSSIKINEGSHGDPIATKTRLGWTIFGTTSGVKTSADFSLHVCECNHELELHDLVKQHFAVESNGVAAVEAPESNENQRARRILEQTTKRISSGRFETGLLWRHDQLDFPNSFPMAMKRWECFERRMEGDPELKNGVHQQIDEYLQDGYIHEASLEELSAPAGKEWYLPLGAVRNSKKPGKIRLVWDAAAKAGGVSLNSALLKGPDFLSDMLGVLCGFRERRIGVCGDIKQMFHQFRIRSEDLPYQKFLFRSSPNEEVRVYVLNVGSFGSTCSPSQAQFIKNRNATDYAETHPRATEAITKRHYVDDYLDSFDSEQEAIEVVQEVITVHASGGFTMRNWLSNSQEVLQRVGEPQTDAVKQLNLSTQGPIERVLGMLWLPREDKFTYAFDISLNNLTVTKRNILRCVMRLFDPLGLISHVLIHGKLIIQEAWRMQLHWDEKVTGEILEWWQKWINVLQNLPNIYINRSYFPGWTTEEIGPLELHVFTDASENAYACVAYFRAIIRGKIYCALVMAKAKVAPLKALSVPRLELEGALLGARLAKTIQTNHSFSISRRFMWTDSSTVLAWIKSDHRKYRQFVSFRVGEILSKTDSSDWNYVPSKYNAADQATKWNKGPSLRMKDSWFNGPSFLYSSENEWPGEPSNGPDESSQELRSTLVHRLVDKDQLIDISRFSRWDRLLRCVSYVKRFVTNIKLQQEKKQRLFGRLGTDEMLWAENYIWTLAQADTYADEIDVLKAGGGKKTIRKSSKIYKLSPFIDDRGVLRMDSRLSGASYATYDFKFPIILPREHRVTELIVASYHRKYLHANAETVINELRQRFHVSKLRAVLGRVVKHCQTCRIKNARPMIPRMAPLPRARLTPWVRPFSFVGIDYFGPLQVRVGRSNVKRWVALFTCLSVRAVHLEVAHSLSADSCKLAIRRFIARRGAPSEIYTDNGTNFQGVSRELRSEIEDINNNLADTFTNTNTKWMFNPPLAAHFGGAWERLVRSVKTALGGLSSSSAPDDETLLTILAEAESIVNSRPLTTIPLKAAGQDVLTPNHFIHLNSNGVVQPPKTLATTERMSRTNWNLARRQIDQFWARWIREYLPTIALRSKWHQEQKPLKVGDLVIIVNEGVRNGWSRGRVVSVIQGNDGRIRQAMVQTPAGVLRRSVSKLAVLNVDSIGKAESEDQRYGSGDVGNTVITASAPHLSDQPTIDLSTSTRHDGSLLTKTNVVDD